MHRSGTHALELLAPVLTHLSMRHCKYAFDSALQRTCCRFSPSKHSRKFCLGGLSKIGGEMGRNSVCGQRRNRSSDCDGNAVAYPDVHAALGVVAQRERSAIRWLVLLGLAAIYLHAHGSPTLHACPPVQCDTQLLSIIVITDTRIALLSEERSPSSNIPTSNILTPGSRYLEHFANGLQKFLQLKHPNG